MAIFNVRGFLFEVLFGRRTPPPSYFDEVE